MKRKYLLIGEEEFERLLRSYYILGKGLLAFEYLCGHSDRPMYLSAEGVCEVLGITRDELDEHRLKRQIKAKVFPAADDVQPLRSGTPRRTSRAP